MHRSQLAINVRYQPPLGRLGALADRALLNRVAEASIKDFMDRVAERLHRQIVDRSGLTSVRSSRIPVPS